MTSRVAAIVTPDEPSAPRNDNALVRAMEQMNREHAGQELHK
jgi:hypothetical protein